MTELWARWRLKSPTFTIVYSTVYSGADQRKHQSSASLAFVLGNHRRTGEFPAQMSSNAENVPICRTGVHATYITKMKAMKSYRIYIYIYNVNGATKITEWYCTLCVETRNTIPSCVVWWYVISSNWIKSWKKQSQLYRYNHNFNFPLNLSQTFLIHFNHLLFNFSSLFCTKGTMGVQSIMRMPANTYQKYSKLCIFVLQANITNHCGLAPSLPQQMSGKTVLG